MNKILLALPAIALYLSATALLWRGHRSGNPQTGRTGILALAAGALLLHGGLLWDDLFGDALYLGFSNSVSLVAWFVTLLFVMSVRFQPIEALGILILPIAALALLIEWLLPGRTVALAGAGPAQASHIVISLLAYSLLSVAMIQSLMLGLQERALHRHQAAGFLRNLPPLETMEALLFRMIAVGFVLLTLTLASGVLFSEQLFGKPFRFTHHTILSLIAWMVFATLLWGRWRHGWRGRTAVRLTLSGFILLVLGYFGSKFVLEVLLKR